jgi:hypothetical protein
MATMLIPSANMPAVRAGDYDALIVAMCALVNAWMSASGHWIGTTVSASSVAREGATPQAGLLAAGIDLCALLAQCPQGRKALSDFGFEPGSAT